MREGGHTVQEENDARALGASCLGADLRGVADSVLVPAAYWLLCYAMRNLLPAASKSGIQCGRREITLLFVGRKELLRCNRFWRQFFSQMLPKGLRTTSDPLVRGEWVGVTRHKSPCAAACEFQQARGTARGFA
jgi:hypothetical protein